MELVAPDVTISCAQTRQPNVRMAALKDSMGLHVAVNVAITVLGMVMNVVLMTGHVHLDVILITMDQGLFVLGVA